MLYYRGIRCAQCKAGRVPLGDPPQSIRNWEGRIVGSIYLCLECRTRTRRCPYCYVPLGLRRVDGTYCSDLCRDLFSKLPKRRSFRKPYRQGKRFQQHPLAA